MKMLNKKYIYVVLFFAMFALTGCPTPPGEMGLKDGSKKPESPYYVQYIKVKNRKNQEVEGVCSKIPESFRPECQYQPVSYIIDRVKTSLLGAGTPAAPGASQVEVSPGVIQLVFNNIVGNPSFQNIVKITATFFIMFYGMGIVLGMVTPSPYDFVMRMIKVCFVLAVISPTFFNAIFFPFVIRVFESFITGASSVYAQMFTNPGITANCAPAPGLSGAPLDVFRILDQVVGMFLSGRFWKLFLVLLFTLPFGPFYALILLLMFVVYAAAVLRGIYMYIFALIARTLLYALAPIFFVFLLFGRTKSMFDGWLKQMINFSLQPVFLLAYLAFFNGIIIQMVSTSFGPPTTMVCYWEVFRLSLGSPISMMIEDLLTRFVDPFARLLDGVPIPPFTLDLGADFRNMIREFLHYLPNAIDDLVQSIFGKPGFQWYFWSLFENVNISTSGMYTQPWKADEDPNQVEWGEFIPINSWLGFIVIILAILMYKMRDWVEEVASQISEGLTTGSYSAPGFMGDPLTSLAGSVGGAAGKTFRGATSAFKALTSKGESPAAPAAREKFRHMGETQADMDVKTAAANAVAAKRAATADQKAIPLAPDRPKPSGEGAGGKAGDTINLGGKKQDTFGFKDD